MLFKRRHKRKFWLRLRHSVNPPGGMRRSLTYNAYRLARLQGGAYNIAAGVACGFSISFTPFLGFHLLGGWLLCLLTRGNAIAMVVGSVIGNPWTFPFIWIFIYYLGLFVLGQEAHEPSVALTMENLRNAPEVIFWPMTVGGVLTAIVAWPIAFFPSYKLVSAYKERRRKKIEAGKKRFRECLAQKFKKENAL